jgi:O-antigen/teichoic acid export membrane protein
MMFAPLFLVFTASNSVMYPRFGEKYGETGDPRSLTRYITMPMVNLAMLTVLPIGAIFVALPALIQLFLPEYNDGVTPARVLLFGLFFYSVAGMAGNMLLTINRQFLRLGILAGCALLNFIFSYGALKLGYGIEGVAIGTSLAYFVFFLGSTIIAMRYSMATPGESLKVVVKVIAPFLYVCGALWLVVNFLKTTPGSTTHIITQTVIQEIVYVALCAYLVYLAFKKLDFIKLLFKRRDSSGIGQEQPDIQ